MKSQPPPSSSKVSASANMLVSQNDGKKSSSSMRRSGTRNRSLKQSCGALSRIRNGDTNPLTALPHDELHLQILNCLPTRDIANCTLVSRSWAVTSQFLLNYRTEDRLGALPPEVQELILMQLSVRDIASCASVSIGWRNMPLASEVVSVSAWVETLRDRKEILQDPNLRAIWATKIANIPGIQDLLLEIVLQSRDEKKDLGLAPTIAITLLVAANQIEEVVIPQVTSLCGTDLRGIRVPGAVLDGALLYEANLEGADLRNVSAKNVGLCDCNLKNCDMDGAVFHDDEYLHERYPDFRSSRQDLAYNANGPILPSQESVANDFDKQIVSICWGYKLVKLKNQENVYELWDLETGRKTRIFHSIKRDIESFSVSNGGKLLATMDSGKGLQVVDLEEDKLISSTLDPLPSPTGLLREWIVFSNDDTRLMFRCNKKMNVFEWEGSALRPVVHSHTHAPNSSYVFSQDKRLLIERARSLSGSGLIRIIPMDEDRGARNLQLQIGAKRTLWPNVPIIFSPDNEMIVVGFEDHQIDLYDANTGERRVTFQYHESTDELDSLTSLVFSPDGKFLIGVDSQENIEIWDYKGAKCVQFLRCKDSLIIDEPRLRFSRDSRYLMCYSRKSKKARIWEFDIDSGVVRLHSKRGRFFGCEGANISGVKNFPAPSGIPDYLSEEWLQRGAVVDSDTKDEKENR